MNTQYADIHAKVSVDRVSEHLEMAPHALKQFVDSELGRFIGEFIVSNDVPKTNGRAQRDMFDEVEYTLSVYLVSDELFNLIKFMGDEKFLYMLGKVNHGDLEAWLKVNTGGNNE